MRSTRHRAKQRQGHAGGGEAHEAQGLTAAGACTGGETMRPASLEAAGFDHTSQGTMVMMRVLNKQGVEGGV